MVKLFRIRYKAMLQWISTTKWVQNSQIRHNPPKKNKQKSVLKKIKNYPKFKNLLDLKKWISRWKKNIKNRDYQR